jgi:hypothetical protein
MALRTLVSKRKKRFVDADHGFDLDLSYVTPNIIAVGADLCFVSHYCGNISKPYHYPPYTEPIPSYGKL